LRRDFKGGLGQRENKNCSLVSEKREQRAESVLGMGIQAVEGKIMEKGKKDGCRYDLSHEAESVSRLAVEECGKKESLKESSGTLVIIGLCRYCKSDLCIVLTDSSGKEGIPWGE